MVMKLADCLQQALEQFDNGIDKQSKNMLKMFTGKKIQVGKETHVGDTWTEHYKDEPCLQNTCKLRTFEEKSPTH